MPKVREGETLNQYLKRAVPEIMKEGKTQKAAVGKAYGLFSNHKKKK